MRFERSENYKNHVGSAKGFLLEIRHLIIVSLISGVSLDVTLEPLYSSIGNL